MTNQRRRILSLITLAMIPLAFASAALAGDGWEALRQCENGGSYTSDGGDYYRGAYQFDQQTWETVGGTGDPAAASPAEQDYRAQVLYDRSGDAPWPVCGAHLDGGPVTPGVVSVSESPADEVVTPAPPATPQPGQPRTTG